jgi:hypothetical protein
MRLNDFDAPTIAALAIASASSGVLIFFHIETTGLIALHEYAGLFFAAAAILHVARHKKAAAGRLFRRSSILVMVSIAAACVCFYAVASALGVRTDELTKETSMKTLSAPIAVSAIVFSLSEEEIKARLFSLGIELESAEESPLEAATRLGVAPEKLLEALLDLR